MVQQTSSPGQTQIVHFVPHPPPPPFFPLLPEYPKCFPSILVQTSLHLVLFGNPWRAYNYCHPRPQEVLLLLYYV